MTAPETVRSNVYCSVMLDYADLFWRTENVPWIFFWLNQLTWRNEQFLLWCSGPLRSVCWSDNGFRIVRGHPRTRQYEYLVFLVVTSDKFFCVPLDSATCSWGQELPCSVFYALRLFAWEWYGWLGESWFWTELLQNQLGGLVRDVSEHIKGNFWAKPM